jgi:tetratricopeptide (TPR) repeat protein
MRGIIRGSRSEVIIFAERLAALSADHETFVGIREGLIAHTWATLNGKSDSILIDRSRSCIEELEAAQHMVNLPFFMAVVAERAGQIGDVDGAMELLERARALAERTNELWYLPEVWRLWSGLLNNNDTESIRMLSDAIDLARRQGAKLWELRASTSLAKLLAKVSDYREARQVLAPALADWPADEHDYIEYQEAEAFLLSIGEKVGGF